MIDPHTAFMLRMDVEQIICKIGWWMGENPEGDQRVTEVAHRLTKAASLLKEATGGLPDEVRQQYAALCAELEAEPLRPVPLTLEEEAAGD